MSSLKFFLLSKLHIEVKTSVIHTVEPQKARELLVYLLLYRTQPQSREHLADVLWSEITPEQSKAYLRKSLWQLQSMLTPYCGPGLLIVNGEWIQINPHYSFWLDVDILENAFNTTQGKPGRDLDQDQLDTLQAAVDVYRGNLLDGWYQDWCLYERERLQHFFFALLDKLMDHCEFHQTYEKGLHYGERILQYDRARERTHRRMMRLYYLTGDRTAALRQYQKCLEALKAELDVEPAERTHYLFEMIRADKPDHIIRPQDSSGHSQSNEDQESLSLLFNHLNAFHNSLTQIQMQIAQDIKVLQRTIHKKY